MWYKWYKLTLWQKIKCTGLVKSKKRSQQIKWRIIFNVTWKNIFRFVILGSLDWFLSFPVHSGYYCTVINAHITRYSVWIGLLFSWSTFQIIKKICKEQNNLYLPILLWMNSILTEIYSISRWLCWGELCNVRLHKWYELTKSSLNEEVLNRFWYEKKLVFHFLLCIGSCPASEIQKGPKTSTSRGIIRGRFWWWRWWWWCGGKLW